MEYQAMAIVKVEKKALVKKAAKVAKSTDSTDSGKKYKLLTETGSNVLDGDAEVGENNLYIKIYGKVIGNGFQPSELEIGETTQKEYNLKGSKVIYTIRRVA
jgi:hypothetical protein